MDCPTVERSDLPANGAVSGEHAILSAGMTGFLHSLLEKTLGVANPRPRQIESINRKRAEFSRLDDAGLRQAFEKAGEPTEAIAATAVAASRVLSLDMFDVQ